MNEKISPPSLEEAIKITLKYIDKFIEVAPYKLAQECYYNKSGSVEEEISMDKTYYLPIFKVFNSAFQELVQRGFLEINLLKESNFRVTDLPYHLYKLTDKGKKHIEELNISDEEIGNSIGANWEMNFRKLKYRLGQ